MTMRPTSMLRYAAVLLLGILIAGCEKTPGDSLWDPDRGTLPAPNVESVDPGEKWLAGVGVITITGSNFSEVPEENLVYFDAQRAEVVSASPTRLVAASPDYVAEDASFRVTVIGSREYSAEMRYRLDPANAPQPGLPQSEQPVSFTYHDGSIFASTLESGIPVGVRLLDIQSESSERYVNPRNWSYTDVAVHPGTGDLFMARGTTPILYRAPLGGGDDEVWLLRGGLGAVAAITVDDEGYIWAAGNNNEIYRVSQAQEVTAYPFDANVRAIVYANNALYLAATSGGIDGAWRIPVDASSAAGAPELVLDVGGEFGGSALSIEASSDGTVFIGTNTQDGIVQVNTDGTAAAMYPGLFSASVVGLAYGEQSESYDGSILYALHERTDEANQILRIESLKPSH